MLSALLNTQRVWLIATLRGDMYEHMITERPFVILKDICGQFDLGPPGADELDEIVHRSAAAAGLQYEERVVQDAAGREQRERLDDRLLHDAAGENTLPLLQFALNMLFEKCWVGHQSKVLTFAAYEEIGGLDGAINQTAEIALARLVRPGVAVQFPLEPQIQKDIDRTINPRLEGLGRRLVVPVGRQADGTEGTGSRALTARLVPLAEACRDGPTEQLIDALVMARILLTAHGEQGSTLRLAHDRVMTSWERARGLIEKNRDFYRIQNAVEDARRRWEEHGKSHEFVIPGGVQIAQAEDVVKRFGEEFSKETREFVAASGYRARRRQRRLKIALGAFVGLFLLMTGGFIYATIEKRVALARLAVAVGTANDLVTSLTDQLKDTDGIKVSFIEELLGKVKPRIDGLAADNAGDPEVLRITASMHFQFAKAFQNTHALPQALREANWALKVRNQLVGLQPTNPGWVADRA